MFGYYIAEGKCERLDLDLVSDGLEGFLRKDDDEHPFIVEPNFEIGDEGTRFRLSRPGLYRFWSSDAGIKSRQILVSDGDAFKFADALSWCFHHSRNDNVVRSHYTSSDMEKSIQLIKRRVLRVTCGSNARLTAYLAILNGNPASVISFKNDDAFIGGSHKMVELHCRVRDRPILIDLDMRCYFTIDNKLAAAQQVLDSIKSKTNKVRICLFSNQNGVEASDFDADVGQGPMDFLGDFVLRTWTGRTQFFNEIFQGIVTRQSPKHDKLLFP